MNLNPVWLIEKYIFDENVDRFKSVFSKYSINYKLMEYFPFMDFNPDEVFSPDKLVIFYGSLNFASKIKNKAKWIPGVWGNLNKLKCSCYYNYYGNYLLNDDYIMLPYGELKRKKNYLFKLFGDNDFIFVRPDSGFKTFTGDVVNYNNYEKEVDFLGFYDVDASNIVVISSPKNIEEEYRFICINKKIVTGCTYKINKEKNEIASFPKEAEQFAQEVANTWQPESCFTIDIAKHEGKYKLLEINSFSSSGFYQCDVEKIVLAANEMAIKEFNEYLD